MNCRNCNTPLQGNYCSQCGEKSRHERFTIRGMMRDVLVEPFTKHRKSLPNTIFKLFERPGIVIRKYMEGERNLLYPSENYLFLVGTITTVLTFRYRFFANEFTDADNEFNMTLLSYLGLEHKEKFLKGFFLYAEEYATILNVIAIPVFALFSYLVFKSKKYTFGEHLVLNTYITAQQLFCLIVLVPLIEFFPGMKYQLMTVYSGLMIFYNTMVLVQFFQAPVVKEIIFSLAAIVLAYVLQFFVNLGVYAVLGEYFRLLDDLKVL